MAWNWNPFKKKPDAEPPRPDKAPDLSADFPKELAGSPMAKGMMSKFYRMWKNPAFLAQLRTLSAHMAKDGVDIKSMDAVKAWLEKNKDGIEAGKFKDPPAQGKAETFVKTGPDVGRNAPCPCGSGKKFKKCCGVKA